MNPRLPTVVLLDITSCIRADIYWHFKGKVRPRKSHEGPKGEKKCSCTLSVTSAPDGDVWSVLRPGPFTTGKETRWPLYWSLDEPQAWSGRGGEENIAPTGIRSPDRSDLSESLNDYAIPSPYWRFEIYFIDSEGGRYISVHLPSCSCQYISQNIHFQHRATWMPSVTKRLVSVFLVTSHYLRYRWQSCWSSCDYCVQYKWIN